MKIILAGGSSALGSDLVSELSLRGHFCQVLSRYPSHGTLPYSALMTAHPDVILNLIGGHAEGLNDSQVQNALEVGKNLVRRASDLAVPLIHLSSGSVLEPRLGPLPSSSPVRQPPFESGYQELKVRLEEMHERSSQLVRTLDLRLFSFVGQSFLAGSRYFLSEALRALESSSELQVSADDFLRDYSGPMELAGAIESAFSEGMQGRLNLYSAKPVSKFELLDALGAEFGLKYSISIGGSKHRSHYYASKETDLLSFEPRSSLEAVMQELRKALTFSK